MSQRLNKTAFENVYGGFVLKKKLWSLLILLLIAGAFGTVAVANRVIVQPVQPLAGNEVTVPAPELQILNSIWRIDPRTSTVVAVYLNVTTVGPATSPATVRLYHIIVQVSSTTPSGRVYTSSTGTAVILLPTNMNGATAIVVVNLTPPVDPETVEIDDLSFIVTALPVTPLATAVPTPSTIVLDPTGTAAFTIPVQSLVGYGLLIGLTASADPGLNVALSTNSVSLTPANNMMTVNGTISLTAPIDPGVYLATIMLSIGSGGAGSGKVALFPITYNIVIILPFPLPRVTIAATPTFLAMELSSGTEVQIVGKIVTSVGGFTGLVTVDASIGSSNPSLTPPTVTPSSTVVNITSPGQQINFTETIDATNANVGFYTLTDTAYYNFFGGTQSVSTNVSIEVFLIT